ncbi:tyrosine-type recombinase/integrase [Eubacteriales bacterium OttesenSCG-928-K08]|nr:tyrosine-type recombinase/integrase [Eubacteriales bacterium OttesenSCG-928-K08]
MSKRILYATMLYDAGVDVKSAQKFMGHANVDITLKVYTHLSSQKEGQAVEALNQHFGAILGNKTVQNKTDAVKMQ